MLIGLTGPSGAGKSSAAALFREAGCRIIDCDALVHSLYEDARYAALVADAFGDEYLSDGVVDRKKLGALVFSEPSALKKLNETVSPFIMSSVKNHIAEAKQTGIPTVLDAPLLFEYGLETDCDMTVGVIAETEILIERLAARDGKPKEALRARLASQHDIYFFRIHCDYILENNGDEDMLRLAFQTIKQKIFS